MASRIRKSTNPREVVRVHRKARIKRAQGSNRGQVPRLVVIRSNKFLYAQVIDDAKGVTLASACTKKDVKMASQKGMDAASALGKVIGERAKSANVEKVMFDRNGYDYHGRIKAIADGAREAGLKF